ncbi:hypothetical protein HELRODRAFT_173605 [Helobdella robusta]|uniref:Uncharacterized protein n=1 Tax=Helobdella robusta TaxID=6412 RepID=T1F711_HELRO|nr:hypothetical protein HELRODRAFT_173605 [Helobdella robusta]ESO03319.1 hypothetical protein HELRODRAFT_173605 [Helobdella robusta]
MCVGMISSEHVLDGESSIIFTKSFSVISGNDSNAARSSMNFENRWVLRFALNFASDGKVVREVGREFQRKGPEKAKADLAKECLTRVKKKRDEEDGAFRFN